MEKTNNLPTVVGDSTKYPTYRDEFICPICKEKTGFSFIEKATLYKKIQLVLNKQNEPVRSRIFWREEYDKEIVLVECNACEGEMTLKKLIKKQNN